MASSTSSPMQKIRKLCRGESWTKTIKAARQHDNKDEYQTDFARHYMEIAEVGCQSRTYKTKASLCERRSAMAAHTSSKSDTIKLQVEHVVSENNRKWKQRGADDMIWYPGCSVVLCAGLGRIPATNHKIYTDRNGNDRGRWQPISRIIGKFTITTNTINKIILSFFSL